MSRASLALLCAALGVGAPAAALAQAGDAERGRLLLRQFGCGSCHRIPGVADARGAVGPPLAGLMRRVYLAGMLPNTPHNLERWIRDPQSLVPGTAMPDLQVGVEHARDLVAYLSTLK